MDNYSTLRTLKGCPLSIVVALIIAPHTSMTQSQLATATGYSKRTVQEATKVLVAAGLCHRIDRFVALTQHTQGILPITHTAQATPERILPPPGRSLPHPAEKTAPVVDVVDLLPRPESQQDTTTAQEKFSALVAAGIWPERARHLAADPKLTFDDITAWITYTEQHPDAIRNPPALIAANLQNHRPPPRPATTSENDWRRFLTPTSPDYL
jgi:hypothetical protein